MSDVLRPDTFSLNDDDFTQSGYYQLRKSERIIETRFLEQILLVDDKKIISEQLSDNFVGVITNNSLYNSIEDGDIVTINNFGQLRVILSRRANHNTLLVTERCNNRCLFCSQPPREERDDWLLTYSAQALAAFDFDGEVGISGGEPLLYGNEFLNFLEFIAKYAPKTKLHILTNGRAFSDLSFTKQIAIRSRQMQITFGVPLYSVKPSVHDGLVGASGAYSETVLGIVNAGNSGIGMEVRFIPTQLNAFELPMVVEFISRVFSSVVQLSIMNLEATGWAKRNWLKLQCDTEQYVEKLKEGVLSADIMGLNPTLFNFPLCHLPDSLRSYAVKSISDWKNYYPDECSLCQLKNSCGGYFSSSRGKYHQNPRRII
ncbi:His-Xaa-Ser system radical SAM maturase HxsC [Photobacterium sp. CCB-ST2H9]|uniref:His-Xaa-Ser system radical SAM maturase HxsC n=1 Tax=Photobacterium sp. CCB-ST2H9 TaxID=2912855 RepID=UPI00200474BF|nr:His-Xaa-Ser system radical SAM maturase HxsC [Photobacterium sp. CCB-ST2H9]UTM59574.1 His-Xaa-Ser system radical SAM maturase HxsC [Photobacterium sp. CCB-ST2H9]